MTHESTEKRGPDKEASFLPMWCKEMAEKMAECGPMMEGMMSRFGADAEKGGCCSGNERPEST